MNNFGYKDWVEDFEKLSPDEAYKKFLQVISRDKEFLTECLICVQKINFDLKDLIVYNSRFGRMIRLYMYYKNKDISKIEQFYDNYEKEFVKNNENITIFETIDYLFWRKIRSIKSELDLKYGILRGWYERYLTLKDELSEDYVLKYDFTMDSRKEILESEYDFIKWCNRVKNFYKWATTTIQFHLKYN